MLGRTSEVTQRLFQSTLPVWGGTTTSRAYLLTGMSFNPPSPCGEGHCLTVYIGACITFQSTLPVWGGTPGTGLIRHQD